MAAATTGGSTRPFEGMKIKGGTRTSRSGKKEERERKGGGETKRKEYRSGGNLYFVVSPSRLK